MLSEINILLELMSD